MTHRDMFGDALWLGADGVTNTPCFRASFESGRASRADITICGLGHFLLYLNGQPVSDDLFVPAVSDYAPRAIFCDHGTPFDEAMRHRCYCLRYSLDGLLTEGQNELAVALGPGFFAEPLASFDDAFVRYGEVRLCYRIRLADQAGNVREVYSNAQARWKQGTVEECSFFRGEKQNPALLPDDWTTAAYGDWQPVRILPDLDTDYQLQDCPTDGVIRTLAPKIVKRFASRVVYDAGENLAGRVVLQDNAREGEAVVVRFSEELNPAKGLSEAFTHGQFFRYVSDGKQRKMYPRFTWNGFRYFSIQGAAVPLAVEVTHARIAVNAAFSCADSGLNWLYRAFVRTQLANLHGGIPSDCPHIERRGYTGDGQHVAETALLCFDYASLFRKWLRDIADCQDLRTGHVQYTAPYTRCGGGPGGWGCAVIMAPYAYYRQTGDKTPLADMYPGMCRYIDYLLAHSECDLVTSDRPGEWCLGDWCAPGSSQIPPPYVNTYFLIKSLMRLQEIERILQLPSQPRWQTIENRARAAICRAYFDAGTGSFCGGVEGADAFAVDIGLGDARTLNALCNRYAALGHYDTGIFGTEIVTRMLLEHGEAEIAYSLLTSKHPTSFEGWRRAGATTLWENWPGDERRSLNHPMFGAVVKELFHYALGVRQDENSAGWESVVISPAFAALLPRAQGHILTPRGKICVSYTTDAGCMRLCVNIPPRARAALLWNGEKTPLHAGRNSLTLPL